MSSAILNDHLANVSRHYQTSQIAIAKLPRRVLLLLSIAAKYAARISEILNVRPEDCCGRDRFYVRGLKRSASYIVEIPVVTSCGTAADFAPGGGNLWLLDYKPVYNWCHRVGIGFTPEGHRNVARTHAHRYYTAQKIASEINAAAASDVLHHRSRQSVQYYLNPGRYTHGKNK